MLFNKSVQSAAASYNRNRRRFDYEDNYRDNREFPILQFMIGVILIFIVTIILLNAFA